MRRVRPCIPVIAALGTLLAAGPVLAQAPPAEAPGGTVFFPGVLVRPDGRPAHLGEAGPQDPAPAAPVRQRLRPRGGKAVPPGRPRRPPRVGDHTKSG